MGYRVGWFVAGVVSVLLLEGAGMWGFVQALPEPRPVEPVPAALVRDITFTMLVPPGYEDMGYVQLDCKPNAAASFLKSGKRIPGPWKKKTLTVAAAGARDKG